MDKMQQSNQEINMPSHNISPRRQAQFLLAITSLIGVILGNSFSQWCYMFDILVGMVLLVASLTGECVLEKIIAKLPWNN
ncbi:MAG: hypothetical protein K2X04_04835 [Burkholderiales bacterium]|jgi:hypothetical protein|nr:hypothetical protein [Burkholderiales bacterium]